jgi:ArsR family transcriptional regulator
MEPGKMMGPTETELARASEMFKALSHPDRLRLTCLLRERRRATQKELIAELGWPQSTVSRHVRVLRDQGLVAGRRTGAEVVLEATNPLSGLLLDVVCDWMHARDGSVERILDAVVAEAAR